MIIREGWMAIPEGPQKALIILADVNNCDIIWSWSNFTDIDCWYMHSCWSVNHSTQHTSSILTFWNGEIDWHTVVRCIILGWCTFTVNIMGKFVALWGISPGNNSIPIIVLRIFVLSCMRFDSFSGAIVIDRDPNCCLHYTISIDISCLISLHATDAVYRLASWIFERMKYFCSPAVNY